MAILNKTFLSTSSTSWWTILLAYMWQTVKTFSEQKLNIFIPLTRPLANLKQIVSATDLLAKRLYLLASPN